MDRQGLLSAVARHADVRVEPHPRARRRSRPRGAVADWRGPLRKLTAPLVFLGSLALKLGSLAKFAAVFVAFGGYALIWGWRFALGLIVLIFVHEMGHFLEASRERLHPSWPVFVPFLGAYVRYTRGNPWQTARVAIAGPMLGGLAALACYLAGRADGSDAARGARILRLRPQPDQPAPVRDPRRRRGVALDALALARRRPREGLIAGDALRGDGASPWRIGARRRLRAPAPALTSSERPAHSAGVSAIVLSRARRSRRARARGSPAASRRGRATSLRSARGSSSGCSASAVGGLALRELRPQLGGRVGLELVRRRRRRRRRQKTPRPEAAGDQHERVPSSSAMLHWCDFSPRPSRRQPGAAHNGAGPTQSMGRTIREHERVRNFAHARRRAAGGARERGHRARPRAGRGRRRAAGTATSPGAGASSPTRSTTRPTASTTCSCSPRRRRRSPRSRACSRSPTA